MAPKARCSVFKYNQYEEKLHDKDGGSGTGDAMQPASNGTAERHRLLPIPQCKQD